MPAVRSKLAIAIPSVVIAVLVVMAAVMAWICLGSRTIAVDRDRVTVEGRMYSTVIPRASIDAGGVRVVDLDKTPDLRPTYRSNGLALPGLREGWFRLANGKRAFVMLTDTSHVVVIPTSDAWLLLSARNSDELAARLRAP